MAEPTWVRDDVILAIHRRQIAEHGGSEAVRDPGHVSSALARPRNRLAYSEQPPDLAALAAAYAFGIVRYHPFLDGNKRTALVVARTFLQLNGCDLKASQEEKYRTFVSLAEAHISEEELADWVRSHLTQQLSPEPESESGQQPP